MYTVCRDISNLNIFRQGSLIAGRSGLSRVVSWPYVAKTLLMEDFFTGGEFVLVAETHVHYTEEILLSFLDICRTSNVSGILVFINSHSRELNHIPGSVIRKANQYEIPLFTMPWAVRTIDIVKQISLLVMQNQTRKNALVSVLRDILFFETAPGQSMYDQLRDLGYDENYEYVLARFQIDNFPAYCAAKKIESENDAHNHKKFVRHNISSLVGDYLRGCTVCSNSNIIVAVVPLSQDSSLEKVILPGLENVNDILSEKFFSLDIRVCLTQVYFGIATLKDAFHETSNLLRLAAYPDNRGAIVFYQTIGLNKLLLETNNPSALRKIYRSKFSPLIEYDLKNNSVLMQTLKAYVMCDCNIEEASGALYIHKNSLRYRLKKIEEVLCCNLNSAKTISEIYTYFLAEDYCAG